MSDICPTLTKQFFPSSPSHPEPPSGDPGQLLHRSPCRRYEIRRAHLPTFPADGIVNVTNSSMILNTSLAPGFEFQIIRAGGPRLQSYLYQIVGTGPGLQPGQAGISPSFNMQNCKFLLHTNGPNYRTRTSRILPLLKQQLADCYRRCLEEAEYYGVKSIAFPCISTGRTLGWPRAVAARIGIDTVRRWFRHPLYGKRRRERVSGPISFLADPVGPCAHQDEAWLIAFNEFFPGSERPIPAPLIQRGDYLLPDRPRLYRLNRSGRGRRMVCTPVLKHEDAVVGTIEEDLAVEDMTHVDPSKRRRESSERSIGDNMDNNGAIVRRPTSSRKRRRKQHEQSSQEQ